MWRKWLLRRTVTQMEEMPLPFSVVIWLAALQVKFCMLMLAVPLGDVN